MTHFILKPFLTIKHHNWTTQNDSNSSATKQINIISTEKQEFVKWLGPKKTFCQWNRILSKNMTKK